MSRLNSETFAKSEKGLNSLVEAVRAIPEGILSILPEGPNKKKLETLLATLTTKEAIQFLAKTQLPSISWNHAKLVAVNGQTLMTGGGIYYPLYTDNEATVHDLQCKVKGEAAISAHSYCDYFWQYVCKIHSSTYARLTLSTDISTVIIRLTSTLSVAIDALLRPIAKPGTKLRHLSLTRSRPLSQQERI